MEMMDSFAKQDVQLEGSCRRNETVYLQTAEELNQEAKLRIERQVRGGKKEV
jgi:V-type H+-transporting ATPase subunit C